MFKLNAFGKISCILGVPAFVLCLLAAHSEQYRVLDYERPLLSPVINYLLKPIGYIERVLFSQNIPTEPTITSLGTNHIFEHEAIIISFIVGFVLSVIALYFVVRAVDKKEYSLWYANGAFTSMLALILVNTYVGVLATIVTSAMVLKIRKNK